MESDPRVPLLPGTGKECSGSGSGADTSETSPTAARRSPPPPPPPPPSPRPRSLLGLGTPKRAISSSPLLPSLPANGIANNQSASSSSSSPSLGLDGEADSDLEAAGRTTQQSPPASSSPHGDNASLPSPAPTPSLFDNHQDPQDPGNENQTSTSPSSSSSSSSSGARSRWNLLGRLRRRASPQLPVSSAQRGSTCCDGFRRTVQEFRQKSARLDSVGVERVIGIFGFSLFGSISLLPYTIDRIKNFSTLGKSFVMYGFGIIWLLASLGVLSGLQGKSDLEQAFCRFTGRLGIVGLAMLVTLHVCWTLPSDNTYCIVGFWTLVVLTLLLHLFSWGWSFLVGEDRIEDKSPPAAQD